MSEDLNIGGAPEPIEEEVKVEETPTETPTETPVEEGKVDEGSAV